MNTLAKLGKFLFYVMIIAVLGGIVYYNRDHYKIAYKNIRQEIGLDKPCSKPIVYYIGEFDAGFGESRSQFVEALSRATAIWDNAVGKELFRYADGLSASTSSDDLPVNLIYDSRQENTQALNNINSTISSSKSSFDSLKAEYDSLQSSVKSQRLAIESRLNIYNQEKNSYDTEVSYWNSHGGASKQKVQNLNDQRASLNAKASSINNDNSKLNETIKELNGKADELNTLGSFINQNVGNYNAVSAKNGPEFQEGEYLSDESGQKIDIYQYKDETKLVRVLAHEFGHALGLDHVADTKAIMYAYNLDPSIVLTVDDIAELKKVCSI